MADHIDKGFPNLDAFQQLLTALATIQTCRVALEEVRAELADCRADKDRGWARVKVLEERIENGRVALEGR